MKKIINLLLTSFMLILIVGCKPESPSHPVEPPIKEELPYTLNDVDGFKFNSEDDSYPCSINFLNSGLKISDIEYPFTHQLLPAEENTDLILFENDFNVDVYIDGEYLTISFHDKHFVTIKDTTFPINKLSFKDSVDDETKELITTGKNLSVKPYTTDEIDSLTFNIQSPNKTLILSFKSNDAKNDFFNQFKSLKLESSSDDIDTSCLAQNHFFLNSYNTFIGEMKLKNGQNIKLDYGCKQISINDTVYLENTNFLLEYIDNIIQDNLITYSINFGAFETKEILTPIKVETKDFLITSENISYSKDYSTSFIEIEPLLNFKSYQLKAYENDKELNELPLDSKAHMIKFVDQSGNIYEFYYNHLELD